MLKKQNVILSSYGSVHNLYCSQSIPISSPNHPSPPTTKCGVTITQRRSYANVRSERSSEHQTDDLLWPRLSHASAIPTPYQILCVKRGDPYSKGRFYELAKIYHPDRNGRENDHARPSSLSGSVKMERYRLIVSAHEILSDPSKRRAYDAFGAGWEGRPDHRAPTYHWGQKTATTWSGFDTNDSPFRNATWEDWEKWYQRGKAKQEPMYFSNGGFLVLVVSAVFLGGFGQSVRVGDYSNIFQRQVEMVHDDASKALRRRKSESEGFNTKNERLQHFLKSRDPHGYGISDPTEENYRKLPPGPETCTSDVVHQTKS